VALPKVSLAFVAACLLAVALPRVALAQRITIDGRLPGVQAQTLTGPNYDITASLGKQVGSNLFHSFGKFGLATNETAAFSGPAAINNVISRVTGGSRSDIDGKIQSNIAGANLFLINPSGIVFGPNATVNVSGAFHASTADYLKMSDGAKFQATNPDGSTLSAAPPAAFGFLTASPMAISVNGSTLGPVAGTLGLVGGPVLINGATLAAPAGAIHVTSAAGTGDVPVDPRNTAALTVSNFGPVDIKGHSKLDVSDPNGLGSGGSVFIRSGALTIDASEINADNYGSGPGGQLVLQADSKITLNNTTNAHAIAQASGNGGDIVLRTSPSGAISVDNSTVMVGSVASGDGGMLSVATGQLTLTQGAALKSDAQGSGNGGPVSISSDAVLLDGGVALDQSTGIFSTTSGTGSGGWVGIVAGQLTLHNGTGVLACAGVLACTDTRARQRSISGAGGNVDVKVDGPLTVDSGASLGTLAFAAGNAGAVSITAAGTVTIDMSVLADVEILDGVGSLTRGTGNAGNVTVGAGTLSIANGGLILAATLALGNGGSISVAVTGGLTIDGAMAPGAVTGITSQADVKSAGNAGAITVGAGAVNILANGAITSVTKGSGDGGRISLRAADSLVIDGTGKASSSFTGITASADPGSTGKAGDLTIDAGGPITVSAGGRVGSATAGPGDAGRVEVTAQGALTLRDPGSKISALAISSGNAGSVTVTAPQITLGSGAEISSTTSGTGGGGSVEVTATGALVLDGAGIANTRIAASATGLQSGAGGPITVTANSLTVEGGAQIASTTSGPGKGGDVNVIVASDIVLPDRGPQITAQSTSSGDAGSITVSAARLLMSNGAAISTAAETANGGNITLNVHDLVYLLGSEISTSVKGETGNGGNITIDPQLVVLDHSSIIARAVEGHGGNITINVGAFIPSADSIVDASSQTGISGTVSITGLFNLSGALVVLSSELRGRAAVLREACAAYGGRPISSLVEAGRGGLPQDPEATLPALYIADRDFNPNPQAGIDKAEASIAPLQTTVRLTMHCG
jgi:filamentous hemagglutinin family protein